MSIPPGMTPTPASSVLPDSDIVAPYANASDRVDASRKIIHGYLSIQVLIAFLIVHVQSLIIVL